MKLVFRSCQFNDLDLLIKISRNTFITAFEKDNDPKYFDDYINSAFSKKAVQQQLQNPHSFFYFIYHHNRLIAYIKLNEKDAQTEQFNETDIELERIYVLPKFIGKGYGKNILNGIIDMVRAKKSSCLWLGVWENNTAAIRFYERHGFKKFGEHPYYIGADKQTDWLMKYVIY